ncbi:hypothetical protein LINGRAHAP2_LOCUS31296 [Linum grandiflorum]
MGFHRSSHSHKHHQIQHSSKLALTSPVLRQRPLLHCPTTTTHRPPPSSSS